MSRTRKNSLAKGRIDCKKAYDTVPHSWIVECLGIFGLAENVKSLSRESRKQNYLNGNNIGKVRRKRGKFDAAVNKQEESCQIVGVSIPDDRGLRKTKMK